MCIMPNLAHLRFDKDGCGDQAQTLYFPRESLLARRDTVVEVLKK